MNNTPLEKQEQINFVDFCKSRNITVISTQNGFKMPKKKKSLFKNEPHWTEGATRCYLRGGICKGCYYREVLNLIDCKMKKTLLVLIAKGKNPRRLKREDVLE